MAWSGYFALGQDETLIEIINVARTEAYATQAGLQWFRPVYNSDLLPAAVGDQIYHSPALDNAPWYDVDNGASAEFFGFYPLNVTGIEDSTRDSQVVESTQDGGIPGRLRYGTKTAVFAGILIASSERGAEYGFRWLNRATEMRGCVETSPNYAGYTLHYLATDPDQDEACAGFVESVRAMTDGGSVQVHVDDPLIDGGDAATTGTLVFDGGDATQTGGVLYSSSPPFIITRPNEVSTGPLADLWRSLRKFKINNGPHIISKNKMSDGGAMWAVQMTGVAGFPWEFGNPQLILHGFTDTLDSDPAGPYPPGIVPGLYDEDGASFVDTACPKPVWTPIYDPNCSAVATPPEPPQVSVACFDPPPSWWRRWAQLPAQYVPLWGDVVPVMTLHATDNDTPMMRVRFYADQDGSGVPQPCAVVGDFVITYAPADSQLVIDGVSQAIYIINPIDGSQRRADSLVMNSDGEPFAWPLMSCGYGYIMTVDMLTEGRTVPKIDLYLVPKAA